jgi:hypothetical protein
MKIFENLSALEFGFGNFSSREIYELTSSLCSCYLDHGIEHALAISFDSHPDDFVRELKFFFLSQEPYNLAESTSMMFTCLGRIDYEFEEIELNSRYIEPNKIDITNLLFSPKEVSSMLATPGPLTLSFTRIFTCVDKIISQQKIQNRSINSVFKLMWNSPLDKRFVNEWDFGRVGNVDYSGTYYLLVHPSKSRPGYNTVNNFFIKDNLEEEQFNEYTQYEVNVKSEIIKHRFF